MISDGFARPDVPYFNREFFRSPESITRLGDGELGGKACGLVSVRTLLGSMLDVTKYPGIDIQVPKMVVLATDVFDEFMRSNSLHEISLANGTDTQIATAFLHAELPPAIVGDLRALIEEVHTPLAVRSSSLLEDKLFQPFAGVYKTKMVPNNQPDADSRFRKLTEAIKFVYASTFFKNARNYILATEHSSADEKMAVIIQEVVGKYHNKRYYPSFSGVGRSYNFFSSGGAEPADGVVNLALGLGKTIVDGGVSWIYSPARPQAPPPFGSVREILRMTQLEFWAVNMGKPPAYDPTAETEYLCKADLAAADYDGVLARIASTYDPRREQLVPGTTIAGPRVVDFAPLLSYSDLPFNVLVKELLVLGEKILGDAVEIEFAVDLPSKPGEGPRFGFLQLRPMLISGEEVEIDAEELSRPNLLLASSRVMGNGTLNSLRDIVYVKPNPFESRFTRQIASEIEQLNRALIEDSRPYLLIGFGRWGSSDPWLGIPVNWGQIAGARVIVEAAIPGMDVEASQGAHLFHNLIGFQVHYLCVPQTREHNALRDNVDRSWLDAQNHTTETEFVRQVRLEKPLLVKVNGRSGKAAIWRP